MNTAQRLSDQFSNAQLYDFAAFSSFGAEGN
jgi:hypothetical protein